ncbi:MAG: hypothetical protein QM711_12865 [Micropruina sp.]
MESKVEQYLKMICRAPAALQPCERRERLRHRLLGRDGARFQRDDHGVGLADNRNLRAARRPPARCACPPRASISARSVAPVRSSAIAAKQHGHSSMMRSGRCALDDFETRIDDLRRGRPLGRFQQLLGRRLADQETVGADGRQRPRQRLADLEPVEAEKRQIAREQLCPSARQCMKPPTAMSSLEKTTASIFASPASKPGQRLAAGQGRARAVEAAARRRGTVPPSRDPSQRPS